MASLSFYVAADMTDFTPGSTGPARLGYHDENTFVIRAAPFRFQYFGDFEYPGRGVEGTLTGFSGYERGALTARARGLDMDIQAFAFGDPRWVQRKLLSGDDVVRGSDFGDTLVAGNGDDRLVGGRGDDTLRGQDGARRFDQLEVSREGRDTIVAFDHTTITIEDVGSRAIGEEDFLF